MKIIQKLKKFVKDHPVITSIVVCTGVAGIATIVTASHSKDVNGLIIAPAENSNTRKFNFTTGKEIFNCSDSECLTIALEDVHTGNLGKLGEELLEQIPELNKLGDNVCLLIGASTQNKN